MICRSRKATKSCNGGRNFSWLMAEMYLRKVCIGLLLFFRFRVYRLRVQGLSAGSRRKLKVVFQP